MYDYVHYAANVPLLAFLFHMCTWLGWASDARIENVHHHLDLFFDAACSKRINGFLFQFRDVGVVITDVYDFRSDEYCCIKLQSMPRRR